MNLKIFFSAVLFFSINAAAEYAGLGKESVTAGTLKKFAPPALNSLMTNKLKKMFDISSPGMGMLSPDKKTLYFSWRVTGQSHVWKIDGPKSFPVQLTSGSDSVTISEISFDGKFLILFSTKSIILSLYNSAFSKYVTTSDFFWI